jgi:hypothetical protein
VVDLPPVPVSTTRPLAPTPPPLSLPHPGIVVSPHRRYKRCGSAPVPVQQTSERPVAASSTPGGWGTTPPSVRTWPALHHPMLGLGCLSHFHPARITTLQTEVPRVSRGHRTRAVSHVWLTAAALFFAGFGPQEVPPPDARCIVLIPLSMYGSLQEQSVAPLKGAPERWRCAAPNGRSDAGAKAIGRRLQCDVRPCTGPRRNGS